MIFITFDNKKKDDFGSQTIKYLIKFTEYLYYCKYINNDVKYIQSPAYVYRWLNEYSLCDNNKILDEDCLDIINIRLKQKKWSKDFKNKFREDALKIKDRVIEWDNFINYSNTYTKIFDVNLNDYEILKDLKINNLNESKKDILLVNPNFDLKVRRNFLLEEFKLKLINNYNLSPKPIIKLDKNKVNITIHIRKVDKESRMARYMNVDDNKYIDLINKINELNYENISINIFSLKKNFNKELYLNLSNVKLFISDYDDNNHLIDFHSMVESDILIIGCSSYSSLAAYYNKNGVIYYNFGRKSYLSDYFSLNDINLNFFNDNIDLKRKIQNDLICISKIKI